ncbi:hypothetical protein AB0O76_21290 [Streptomyces sp. NPDC086554]|uniref:hypothetical protein n=1 Tax=Streptomyces sp. NPDC086554 TaxID=3154864 RepID=UPI00341998FD
MGARLTGSVKLISARVGGQLNFTKAVLDNRESAQEDIVALEAYGLDVPPSGIHRPRRGQDAAGADRRRSGLFAGQIRQTGQTIRTDRVDFRA